MVAGIKFEDDGVAHSGDDAVGVETEAAVADIHVVGGSSNILGKS